VVSLTPRPLYRRGKSPRYPLERRLGGPQNRAGRRGEEKILDPTGTRTPTPLSIARVYHTKCEVLSKQREVLSYEYYVGHHLGHIYDISNILQTGPLIRYKEAKDRTQMGPLERASLSLVELQC
jgi:hypothetical protein